MLYEHFFSPQAKSECDLGGKGGGNKGAPAHPTPPLPRTPPLARGSRGHLGSTVTRSGHDSPPPPSYTSLSEQDSRSAIAIWLPSCSNASLLSAAGDTRRCPRGAACSDAWGAGPAARHGTARQSKAQARNTGGSLGRCTWAAARSPLARSGTKREPAPGGSAASPPASARPSPAQVACGIAEPQLGRLPSPRTERRGSWRHVNDVLSYFH